MSYQHSSSAQELTPDRGTMAISLREQQPQIAIEKGQPDNSIEMLCDRFSQLSSQKSLERRKFFICAWKCPIYGSI